AKSNAAAAKSAGRTSVPAASNPIGANASTGGVSPNVAPSIVASFDGINQATACGTCSPPDVSAAVGQAEIAEMTNGRLQVFTKTGTVHCALDLALFLGTADSLAHPRIIYDSFNQRFGFVVSVLPSGDSVPALWVAASSNDEGCGLWNASRVEFSGGNFPA